MNLYPRKIQSNEGGVILMSKRKKDRIATHNGYFTHRNGSLEE